MFDGSVRGPGFVIWSPLGWMRYMGREGGILGDLASRKLIINIQSHAAGNEAMKASFLVALVL